MAKAGYTFETMTGVQGHGTMAQQDAHAVAITGGTASLSGTLTVFGDTGLTGLNVNGQAAFYQPVLFEEQITTNGALNAAGSVSLNGTLNVLGIRG